MHQHRADKNTGDYMIKKMMAVALASSAVASPASAHWQYTRWEMTPNQVVVASKGSVQRFDPALDVTAPYGVKEAAGTYTSGGRTMKASFWFAGGKLSRVNLSNDDTDACFALERDMASVYGQPTTRSGGSMLTTSLWRDVAKGNRVQFSNWSTGGCDLIYSPLATADSTGL
ncbi:MAG: hypothetical protein ACSLE1_02365 [Sphingobium sp.]